jgi:hypothetical protein
MEHQKLWIRWRRLTIFIKTFSWGFPTGRSFTTYSHVNLAPEVFCHRCRVLKKKLSHHHHRAINKFSGVVAGDLTTFSHVNYAPAKR